MWTEVDNSRQLQILFKSNIFCIKCTKIGNPGVDFKWTEVGNPGADFKWTKVDNESPTSDFIKEYIFALN